MSVDAVRSLQEAKHLAIVMGLEETQKNIADFIDFTIYKSENKLLNQKKVNRILSKLCKEMVEIAKQEVVHFGVKRKNSVSSFFRVMKFSVLILGGSSLGLLFIGGHDLFAVFLGGITILSIVTYAKTKANYDANTPIFRNNTTALFSILEYATKEMSKKVH
ncbi:MAG: hypothetical protein ABII22_01125 [Candidatus Micrarchaeota archaeon]